MRRRRFSASFFPLSQATLETAGSGYSKAAERDRSCTGKEVLKPVSDLELSGKCAHVQYSRWVLRRVPACWVSASRQPGQWTLIKGQPAGFQEGRQALVCGE